MKNDLMTEQLPWAVRGFPEHDQHIAQSPSASLRLSQVSRGLDLLAYVIETSAKGVNFSRTTNTLAAIACYTRAFRGLRAATSLVLNGFYLEAKIYLRDVYESAGLARMLAVKPQKADDWLLRDRWVKDNEVRQYIESVLMPGVPADQSPYREYYRQSSELHHPTRRGCLPLVLDSPTAECIPKLIPTFDEDQFESGLREIAAEAVFVGFTVINAASNDAAIDPDWRRALAELAQEITAGVDMSHLDRDWEADEARFADLQSHVIDANGIDAELNRQANSVRNILRRQGEAGQGS